MRLHALNGTHDLCCLGLHAGLRCIGPGGTQCLKRAKSSATLLARSSAAFTRPSVAFSTSLTRLSIFHQMPQWALATRERISGDVSILQIGR